MNIKRKKISDTYLFHYEIDGKIVAELHIVPYHKGTFKVSNIEVDEEFRRSRVMLFEGTSFNPFFIRN